MADSTNATWGSSSANSYITSTQAKEYIDNHINSATSNIWDNASSNAQRISVQMATRLLDEWIDWYGSRESEDQALRWPRVGVLDRDHYLLGSDVLPTFLKNATAELARVLLTSGDPTANPDTLGFNKLKVGDLELDINQSDRDTFGAIPDSVRSIVEQYGSIRTRGTPSIVTLART